MQIASLKHMRQKISDWIERYKCMDLGMLYMRMVLGGSLLLHNIGKMQNYNEIINSYPSLLYINNTASFVIVTVVEVLLAVLLMMGLWVRFSAMVMAAGMIWVLFSLGFPAGELELLYASTYILLVITGGGLYSFDAIVLPRKGKRSNQ